MQQDFTNKVVFTLKSDKFMKTRMNFYLNLLVLIGVFMAFISSCKENNGSFPDMVTSPVNYIS